MAQNIRELVTHLLSLPGEGNPHSEGRVHARDGWILVVRADLRRKESDELESVIVTYPAELRGYGQVIDLTETPEFDDLHKVSDS